MKLRLQNRVSRGIPARRLIEVRREDRALSTTRTGIDQDHGHIPALIVRTSQVTGQC